jgi:hypothetical protein
MIKPEPALERVWKITNHIPLGNRDLRSGNGQRTSKDYLLQFQNPRAEGSTDQAIKVVVGDDLLVGRREEFTHQEILTIFSQVDNRQEIH